MKVCGECGVVDYWQRFWDRVPLCVEFSSHGAKDTCTIE